MSSDDKDTKDSGVNVDVRASAKYEVKKNITQIIPEDVTRERSNAWLDIISPITEWAALKGDELRQKRELLRIEQEETLYKVGMQAKKRLMELGAKSAPVPTKALIPILEKASLEEPDSVLIEAWGNLLASASADYDVEVITFAEILSGIGPREAEIVKELIRVSDIAQWNDRQKRATAGTGFDIYDKAAVIKPLILKALDEEDHSIFDRLRKNFFPTGYPVLITKIQKGVSTGRANKIDTIFESKFVSARAPGFEILGRQGLIKERYAGFSWQPNSDDGPSGISWYEFTELGFAFVLRIAIGPEKKAKTN